MEWGGFMRRPIRKFMAYIVLFAFIGGFIGGFASQAQALNFMYLKTQLSVPVKVSESFDDVEVDTDIKAPYPLVLGLGFYLTPLASFSLDLDYEVSGFDDITEGFTDGEKIQLSATLNFYLHAPEILSVEPFLGFGAGYTSISIEDGDYMREMGLFGRFLEV